VVVALAVPTVTLCTVALSAVALSTVPLPTVALSPGELSQLPQSTVPPQPSSMKPHERATAHVTGAHPSDVALVDSGKSQPPQRVGFVVARVALELDCERGARSSVVPGVLLDEPAAVVAPSPNGCSSSTLPPHATAFAARGAMARSVRMARGERRVRLMKMPRDGCMLRGVGDQGLPASRSTPMDASKQQAATKAIGASLPASLGVEATVSEVNAVVETPNVSVVNDVAATPYVSEVNEVAATLAVKLFDVSELKDE